MIARFSRTAVAAATVLSCAVLSCTNAVAVSIQGVDIDFLPSVAELANPAPSSGTAPLVTVPPMSIGGTHRSPFEQLDQTLTPGYETAQFRYVPGTGGVNNSATYNFAAGTTKFALLWGSPDSYNTLDFYSEVDGGGDPLGSFSLADLQAVNDFTPVGLGHAYVTFLAGIGESIGSVIFRSTTAAFEFAHVNTGPGGGGGEVPLPPALILFGSALVGLTVLGRRRRAARSAAA